MLYNINCLIQKSGFRIRGIITLICLVCALPLSAQQKVALPLNSYGNYNNQVLTPAIVVTKDQTVPPDITILFNGGPMPAWLAFKTNDPDPASLDFHIILYVPTGQCVPRPLGATDCGTECGSAIPAFGGFPLRECHTLNITAYGAAYTANLCVYGDPALTIEPASQHFDEQVASETEKAWTTNRSSNLVWSLAPGSGVNSGSLKIVAGTENTKEVKLKYAPEAAENGTYTLKVSTQNTNLEFPDVCDAPATRVINVKATDVPAAGSRVDLILVVDVSGSMSEKGECLPDDRGPQYNPADFTSKMSFVRSNLRGIYGKIVEVKPEAGSRVGFITFADDSEKKTINGKFFNNIDDAATTTGINSIIEGLTATSSTNMGAALRDAVDELKNNSSAPKKQIILITNGMQNGNIMVRSENGVAYIDKNINRKLDMGEEIPDNIQVFSIAIFQPSNEYLDLLKILSKGDSRFMDVCKLTEAMDEAFAKSYANNSPKNVGYRRGNFAGGTTTVNYSLTEKEFDRIIVSLSSMANSTTTDFRFEKNVSGTWVDITSGGSKKQVAPNYTLFTISGLPKMVNGVNVTPQGQYRLVATSSQSSADYFTSAIVDDRGLKQATFVESKTVRAGNSFGLSARVRYGVAPVHASGVNIKAVIHRPVLSFEKIMAQSKVSGDKIVKRPWNQEKASGFFKRYGLKPASGYTFEPNLPLIDQKFQVLVYENAFLTKIKFETDTVTLSETSNGVYKAQYSNTSVSGVYRIEYLINGDVPGTGVFFRTSSHTTPVLFGTPDKPKSDFFLFDDAGTYFLSLKPVDIYGNYLGMGKADQITMTMTEGSHYQLLDQLNGKYVIPLNVPANANPYVNIKIAGMDFYSGYLFDIPQDKWFFGIQAGIASPTGNFNTTADPGLMAGLKLGYRLNRKFGLLAEGGYFGFKDSTGSSSNLRIIGGGAGLFFIPTSLPVAGGLHVQLESTFGYYKPKNLDGEWGIRAGIDLGKYFKTWFSLSLNASYYTINTSPNKIQFIGTSLIGKFHF